MSALVIASIALLLQSAPSWQETRQLVRSSFPEVRQLSVERLRRRLDAGEATVLLDVREREEYAVSHIAGAQRVDPDAAALPASLRELPRDATIVAYCSVGYRSSALVRRLMRLGFSDVANLEGSIFWWANRGEPVVRDGVVVHEVHPYDERWGLLLEPHLRAPLGERSPE